MEKKSIASDWIGHVTCIAHGLKEDEPIKYKLKRN